MEALARAWYRRRGLAVDVAPAVFYAVLLLLIGLLPLKSLPGPDFKLADKVWHLLAFGGLTALLDRTFRYFGRPAVAAAGLAALLSAALGGLLEVFQSLTRYRSAEFADLVADVLGAALGYVVLRLLANVAGPVDARS